MFFIRAENTVGARSAQWSHLDEPACILADRTAAARLARPASRPRGSSMHTDEKRIRTQSTILYKTPWRKLNHEHIDEFVYRRRFQALCILAQRENRIALFLREAPRQVGLELLHQQRDAILAPATMPNRIFYDDFPGFLAVLELDRNRIGDRALIRIVVVAVKSPCPRRTAFYRAGHRCADRRPPRPRSRPRSAGRK